MSKGRIPYTTITAAKSGDPEAMETILDFFAPYIRRASKRTLLNDFGNRIEFVDQDIKQRIEQKLMLEIIYRFDCNRLPEGETLED